MRLIAQRRRTAFAPMVAFALLPLLVNCGGGGAPQPIPARSALQQSVTVAVRVVLPNASGTRPAYISPATESIGIVVTPQGDQALPPVTGNCSSGTCDATVLAPIGPDSFAVSLYSSTNATGAVLSTGTVVQSIMAGTANSVNITFDGVPASATLMLTPSSITLGTATTLTLTAIVKDASGNTIVGTYLNPLTITDSDSSGATTLSTPTIASSSDVATLTYNGSRSFSQATITAAVQGVSSSNLPPVTLSPAAGQNQFTWLIGEDDASAMNAVTYNGTTDAAVFASNIAKPIIILATKPDVDGTSNDCVNNSPTAFDSSEPASFWNTAQYMYRYTAECQFAVDLAAPSGGAGFHGAIPPWISWIMYDNELCTLPATPYNEQENPPTYYTQAATLAHANGLKLYGTGGLHRALAGTTSNCTAPDPAYAPASLWATDGPPGTSSAWNAVDFQTQTAISPSPPPTQFIANINLLRKNALANNSDLIVAAGIGDLGCDASKNCGPLSVSTIEVAVNAMIADSVFASWGNFGAHPVSGSGTGDCTIGPPACPMAAEPTEFAQIIIITAQSMPSPPPP